MYCALVMNVIYSCAYAQLLRPVPNRCRCTAASIGCAVSRQDNSTVCVSEYKQRLSVAREIKRKGAPKPLRNLQRIKGFKSLKRMTDRARVNAANKLVESMTHWCRYLSSRGVCWSIENPSNSLIWAYPGLSDLVANAHVACMFGSQRKKATALASNRSWFRMTAVQCSGDHPHASWGKTRSSGKPVWATSLRVRTPQSSAMPGHRVLRRLWRLTFVRPLGPRSGVARRYAMLLRLLL